jgi:putative colanic acid biosynthesis acetyltransferase WcaF
MTVDLSLTTNRNYVPGRSPIIRGLWMLVEALVLLNPILTSYRLKCAVLRAFGAQIGTGLIIKPGVHVKYPWRLCIGDNCWIGERAWLDNMENITLGSNVVVSQGAYLCTGNHDWSDPGMGLTPEPIVVENGAWIGAFARVAPAVRVGRESVLGLGAVLLKDSEASGVYVGNPATFARGRTVRDYPGPARSETSHIDVSVGAGS